MRRSDLAARRHVAILALRQANWTLKEACNHVAKRVCGDRSWAALANSIKTGFEKYSPSYPVAWWITGFYDWLNVEIKENLFDHGNSISDLFTVMEFHAERVFADRQKAAAFVERYKQLVARAVILIGRRIDRSALR